MPHLKGIEAVINCAGVLQDSPGETTSMVHHLGVANLFTACEQLQIRRVIHFSAMESIVKPRAISRRQSSSRVILRSSRAERGLDYSAPLSSDWAPGLRRQCADARVSRAAASMPIMPNAGPLQVVLLEDVVGRISFCLMWQRLLERSSNWLARISILSGEGIMTLIRRWYRWTPAWQAYHQNHVRLYHLQGRRYDFAVGLAAPCAQHGRT